MKIVFIIGVARSGTSIVGELVASHPSVQYVFEAHKIWEKVRSDVNGSHRLTASDAVGSKSKEIRQWFELHADPAKSVLVEKNPRNILRIPFIREMFPEAKIIHIIRDGRDVACSLMPGIGGKEWKHLKPPGWQKCFLENEGIERCSLVWKECISIAFRDLLSVPHLEIKYEDLVRYPEKAASAVMDFIGLDQHENVIEFCNKIMDQTKNSYHAERQKKWFRDDHRKRIGRWRENLTESQARLVNNILRDTLKRLNYDNDV